MRRRKFLGSSAALGAIAIMPNSIMATEQRKLYVPPEEALHELTFMQWPASRKVHREREFFALLQETIADIANTISQFEPVVMLAAKEQHSAAHELLSEDVDLWDIPTEDLWCRDAGPLFAIDETGELVVSHIQFNGWGNRQLNANDSQVATRIAERLGVELVPSGLVGEAGGVEHDGHGLLMAHESSWVHKNRNPGLSRDEIGKRLLAAYGAERIIWAPGVKDWDITDYHIDSLARFTGPGRVLINLPDLPDYEDPFHVAALKTHEILKREELEIEVISEPDDRRVPGVEFVASYANYYVCNGAVIAAQFGDPESDPMALEAMRRHFPGREVIALDVDPLGETGGGIHCATQQMPKSGN